MSSLSHVDFQHIATVDFYLWDDAELIEFFTRVFADSRKPRARNFYNNWIKRLEKIEDNLKYASQHTCKQYVGAVAEHDVALRLYIRNLMLVCSARRTAVFKSDVLFTRIQKAVTFTRIRKCVEAAVMQAMADGQ